jgi:hypothetical protein
MKMKRRDFIKASVGVFGSAALSRLPGLSFPAAVLSDVAPTTSRVEYARQAIPPFELPHFLGQRYDDNVPDTLDIAERARLGLHVLTSITDPASDYEIYWLTDFFRQPPAMVHDFNDWVQLGEGLMESLPLMRLASGDDMNAAVDPAWMGSLLKSVGADGLVYLPLNGRPWARKNWAEVDPIWGPDGTSKPFEGSSVSQVTNGFYLARALGVLNVYYALDGNSLWKNTLEGIVRRSADIAVKRRDYAYLPSGSFEPNANLNHSPEPVGFLAQEGTGRPIQGLCQFYRLTKQQDAIVLAGKFARFFVDRSGYYDEEGRWLETEYIRNGFKKYFPNDLKFGGHSHGHALGLLCVLEYATAANDKEMLDWVRRSYEWGRDAGVSQYGASTLVGWFPEVYGVEYPSCEADTLGDMIPLALKLTAAGAGDYWDDVDRWSRNHFAESQLTKPQWLYEFAAHQPKKPIASNETSDHVPERNVGAFAGWASPNEWTIRNGIMHCCTGNCTRALYYLWQNILEQKPGQLKVNLLLNRASATADVYSYVPFEGKLDVKLKSGVDRLLIRVPEWIETGSPEVTCKMNGAARPIHWEGRYVNLGGAKRGDRATLLFPIRERTVREKIGPETYTLSLRGNTVISIDPTGKTGVLYAGRGMYSEGTTRWRRVRRFVPDRELAW